MITPISRLSRVEILSSHRSIKDLRDATLVLTGPERVADGHVQNRKVFLALSRTAPGGAWQAAMNDSGHEQTAIADSGPSECSVWSPLAFSVIEASLK